MTAPTIISAALILITIMHSFMQWPGQDVEYQDDVHTSGSWQITISEAGLCSGSGKSQFIIN